MKTKDSYIIVTWKRHEEKKANKKLTLKEQILDIINNNNTIQNYRLN